MTRNIFRLAKAVQEDIKMNTAIIGIIVTAIAIEADKLTQYRHHSLPLVALAGVLTVMLSLVL